MRPQTFSLIVPSPGSSRAAQPMSDLRFFLSAYAGGLALFLTIWA